MIEIEVKERIDDFDDMGGRLDELGAEFQGMESHVDIYFNHPRKDFRRTDEALRVRKTDGRCFLVYKGPKIGDANTKTREEIEIGIDGDLCKDLVEILDRLDFRRAAVVRKDRWVYKTRNLEICLDDVEGLGKFIEVETLKEMSMNAEEIFDFMEKLGVSRDEFITESYLELLMHGV